MLLDRAGSVLALGEGGGLDGVERLLAATRTISISLPRQADELEAHAVGAAERTA
jgi:hypothetical protein